MNAYKPTIGLEIHFEAKTQTKMFCGCLNNSKEKEPNKNICPVCTGQPGALPVANIEAIRKIIALGVALDCEILEVSKFDRKNYFYPDLPKGYQISQYDKPFCINGYLDLPSGKKVRIHRIHLEEDTARLAHAPDGKSSLVDYNRSSVPLIELVTEPDIESGEQSIEFAKELQKILRYLKISDAEMESGEMRVEVNISLSKDKTLGTKVEVKNLNSFKAVQGSVDQEIERQTELLEKGEKIIQETRGWNDAKQATFSQRKKEEAHDYRYFPEPDLPPIDTRELDIESIKAVLPELPAQKRFRFRKEYDLRDDQIDLLTEWREQADWFEKSISEILADEKNKKEAIQLTSNYFLADLKGLINESGDDFSQIKITPENFADLIQLNVSGTISSPMTKAALREMYVSGEDPKKIIEEKGWKQVSDSSAIGSIIEEVINENPNVVADYKSGKENAIQFLFGQAMKKLKGQGSPEVIREELDKILNPKS